MCRHEDTGSALIRGVVTQHELVAVRLWRMAVSVPAWKGDDPEPGQFVMLRVGDGSDPLLGRPFGIAGFWREDEGAVFEIFYRVVGRGTAFMQGWGRGRGVDFLGPLGRGFTLPPVGTRSLLVAGGVGLPPLMALARKMSSMQRDGELTILYGDATRQHMVDLESRIFPSVAVHLSTEDGSAGTHGLVTDLLRTRAEGQGQHLFICGPNAMMRAVYQRAGTHCLSAQYSLEARMACGFGVCSGCAVKTASGDYVRVCREGPVFDGEDLSEDSFGEI